YGVGAVVGIEKVMHCKTGRKILVAGIAMKYRGRNERTGAVRGARKWRGNHLTESADGSIVWMPAPSDVRELADGEPDAAQFGGFVGKQRRCPFEQFVSMRGCA